MNALDNIYAVAITISVIVAFIFVLRGLHLAFHPGRVIQRHDTRVQMLLDERDRLLLNLNDLRYDHAVEKVSEADRDLMEAELRDTLSDVLRQLQGLGVEVDLPRKAYAERGGRYGQ
jgi:hypothetical protein